MLNATFGRPVAMHMLTDLGHFQGSLGSKNHAHAEPGRVGLVNVALVFTNLYQTQCNVPLTYVGEQHINHDRLE